MFESLEQRWLMASNLDLSAPSGAAVLTFNNGNNSAKTLTISEVGGQMTYNDSSETITLGGNAASQGWQLDATGHIATGPDASVSTMQISLGFGADTVEVNTPLSKPITALNADGSSNNTLVGPDATNTWLLSGAKSGTLSWNGDPTPDVTFTNFQHVVGGLGNDTFEFPAGPTIAFMGTVDGGAGGYDTIDCSAITSDVDLEVTGPGTHHGYAGDNADDFDNLIGSSGTSNSLRGPLLGGTDWVVSGTNAGSLSQTGPSALPLNFSKFQTLKGGTNDTFYFEGTGNLAGDLDAGIVTDGKLDYSNYDIGVSVNLGANKATGVAGHVHHVNEVMGSAFDDTFNGPDPLTLTTFDISPGHDAITSTLLTATEINGPNADATWALTDFNKGSVSFAGGTTTFSVPALSVLSLQGGTGSDTFQFQGSGGILGVLGGGGGAGTDTLDYSQYGSQANVNLPLGAASGVNLGLPLGVSDIEKVIGSPGNDSITGNGSTAVVATGGVDNVNNAGSLQGTDADNAWNITGNKSGQLVFGPNVTTFNNVPTLKGGAGVDTFKVFGKNDSVSKIDGGNSGINTLDLSPIVGYYGDVNLSGPGTAIGFAGNAWGASFVGAFDNINNVVGSTNPTVAENSINAAGYADTLLPKVTPFLVWDVTGSDAGKVTEMSRGRSLTFSQTNEMYGASNFDDWFTFEAGAGISGGLYDSSMPGTGTTGNVLDYAAYTSPVTVDLKSPVQSATGTGNIEGHFGAILGGKNGNTLTAENVNPLLTTLGAGTTLVAGGGTNVLTGGNGNDHFVWNTADGPTTIEGGGTSPVDSAVSSKHGDDLVTVDGTPAGGDNFKLVKSGSALKMLNNATDVLSMTNIQVISVNAGGGGSNSLTVDSSGGTPIPVPNSATNGLAFYGAGLNNTLSFVGSLPGGPYHNESYHLTGGGNGTANLDGFSVKFSGLSPIVDTTPATHLDVYMGAGTQSFDIVNGPAIGTLQTGLIASDVSPAAFEQITFANKENVSVNPNDSSDPTQATLEESVRVNMPILPTGLSSLSLNTGQQGDTVSLDALPGGIDASVYTSGGNDQVAVALGSVPASTTLNVDGGTGANQLDVNAKGGTSVGTISSSLVSAGYADGTHAVNYANFATVPVVNYPNAAPNPGPVVTLNAVQGVQVTNAIVASFRDASPEAKASDFSATINWGDGPGNPSGGTIVQDAHDPTIFYVEGSPTYPNTGKFAIQVTVQSLGHYYSTTSGSTTVTVSSTVSALSVANGSAVVPISITGQMSPNSDGGISNSDGITNINTPIFAGTTAAGAKVTLTATPMNGGAAIVMGQTVAASNGYWSITSTPLPDGFYTVTALAVDASGATSASAQLMPSGGMGPLVIDTTGIVVTGAQLNPVNGTVTLNLEDPEADILALSIGNIANYRLTRVGWPRAMFNVTNVSMTQNGSATTVTIQFNGGRLLHHSAYQFTALSKSLMNALGLQDKAGNGLQGGDYVATFRVTGSSPVTIGSSVGAPATAPPAAAGHAVRLAHTPVRRTPHLKVTLGAHHPAGAKHVSVRHAAVRTPRHR